MCCRPLPGHGSIPNLTDVPSPTLHARVSLINVKDFMIAFQKIEPPLHIFSSLLTQAIRLDGAIYFWMITYVHRLEVDNSLHPHFAASVEEKRKIFFSPQPPSAFGMAILSHFTHGLEWHSD